MHPDCTTIFHNLPSLVRYIFSFLVSKLMFCCFIEKIFYIAVGFDQARLQKAKVHPLMTRKNFTEALLLHAYMQVALFVSAANAKKIIGKTDPPMSMEKELDRIFYEVMKPTSSNTVVPPSLVSLLYSLYCFFEMC